MADITISADQIAAVLDQRLAGYNPTLEMNQVGEVAEVGDGIARVTGLPACSKSATGSPGFTASPA